MPGLDLSTQDRLDADATITVGATASHSPRSINRELWRPDQHDLADALLRALRGLLDDVPRASRRATLVEEHDVRAVEEEYHGPSNEYHYASMAAQALDSQLQTMRLVQFTRQLGYPTSFSKPTSLDDVYDGPVKILEAADADARLDVRLESFFDLKSNQREALLRYLIGLSPGVDVRIIGMQPELLNLIDKHDDVLPASVTQSAETRLTGSERVATRTAERRDRARDLLAEKGPDHDDWRRLAVLAGQPRERARFDALETHSFFEIPSRAALRKWVARMSDHDLVEATGSSQERRVRLLPTGAALLALHPDLDAPTSHDAAGRTDVSSQPMDCSQRSGQTTVSDPPKTHDSPVYSPTADDGPRDRPADEARTAVAGGSDAASRRQLGARFLDGWEHDAAAAAAAPGEIALCDRRLGDVDDRREVAWSFLDERDEVVVRTNASSWSALTMVRVCSALLSEPAFQQVLTVNRLAGGEGRNGLAGLPVDNPYVLRDGACLGWLQNTDANARSLRKRLRQARNGLEQLAADLTPLDGADEDDIAQLLREAHGLHGVVSRIYDMLGVDVHRMIDTPTWAIEDDDRRKHLTKTLSKASAIASRYGVYSANRVLYEPRPGKREQLLGAPDVSQSDPKGDLCGSWMLVGPDVSDLRGDIESMTRDLVLQTDADNYSPFVVDVDCVDANRQAAYTVALSRRASLRHMEHTRETTATLQALSNDILAAARGMARLGSEEEMPREMDLYDVRTALSHLDSDELVTDIGPQSVSRVVATLLDVEESVSKSELANLAGLTTEALSQQSDYFADLEAVGILRREDQGPGKATLWRLELPFESERRDADAPAPMPGDDDQDYSSEPVHAVADALFAAHHRDIDYGSAWFLDATSQPGDLSVLARRRPDLLALVRLVVQLIGWCPTELPLEGAVRHGTDPCLQDASTTVEFGQDPFPTTTQQSISATGD